MDKSLVTLVAAFAFMGCSSSPESGLDQADPTGAVVAAIFQDGISGDPKTCVVQRGSSVCPVMLRWTKSDPATASQVWVRMDGSPFGYFACTPPNGTNLTQDAPWIQPGHSYDFSLRIAADCTAAPSAQEVARATGLMGFTARLRADLSDESFFRAHVGTNGFASATIREEAPTYGDPVLGAYRTVWMSEFDGTSWLNGGAPTMFFCGTPSQTTPLYATKSDMVEGHSYRFSLRICKPGDPSCNGCGTMSPNFPEVASVTVEPYRAYFTATSCSAPPGSSCTSTLEWASSSPAPTKLIQRDVTTGTTTDLGCVAPSGGWQVSLASSKQYSFDLIYVSSCAATTGTLVTSTRRPVVALSDILVRDGATLSIAGQPLKASAMNKVDLFTDYLVRAPTLNEDPAHCNSPDLGYCPLTCSDPDPSSASFESAAKTAMNQAASNGIQYLRINGAGHFPSWMQLWQQCPAKYWAKFDRLRTYANGRSYPSGQVQGLKLIPSISFNSHLFADMTGGTVRDLVRDNHRCSDLQANPSLGTASKRLLCKYISDMVQRYKDDTVIQAWELMNELELEADAGDTPSYTTNDMVEFVRTLANHIRDCVPDGNGGFYGGCDGKHLITAGYGSPRLSAAYLRANPAWSGSPIAWGLDDLNMFENHVRYINPDPIDLVSMHTYNGWLDDSHPEFGRYNEIFGLTGVNNAGAFFYYDRAARRANKPLFLGEMNDAFGCYTGCALPKVPLRPFGRGAMQKIAELHIPLWAPWSWDLAATSIPWYNIQPGLDAPTDDYIAFFKNTVTLANSGRDSTNATPPNPGFDQGSTSSGSDTIPTSWTKAGTGSVSVVDETFAGKAVRLTAPGTAAVTLDSTAVALGFAPSSTARLAVSTAVLADAAVTTATVKVMAYASTNGTGTALATLTLNAVDVDRGSFKLRWGKSGTSPFVALPTTAGSIKVRLTAAGAGSATFDDVRVLVTY